MRDYGIADEHCIKDILVEVDTDNVSTSLNVHTFFAIKCINSHIVLVLIVGRKNKF